MIEKKLGVKLTETIWEHDPRITNVKDRLACVEACAEAAVDVAAILGCLIATIAVVSGKEDEIDRLIEQLLQQTRTSTHRVMTKAVAQMTGHA